MHISLAAEKIFHIGNFPITNTLLMAWVVMVILAAAAFILSRKKMELAPKGLQNIVEIFVETFLKITQSVIGEKKLSEKALPLVATFFIFILLANWMGILPGVGTIGLEKISAGEKIFVPFFRSAYSDLNMTLALAIISILAVQIFGIASLGLFKYAKKFINFQSPVAFFVGILELISEFAKIISFSFRLFGNIFAGEVLLIVIAFLVPFVAPVPFMFLEIFVGFIQALVFTMLTLVFIKMATIAH